MKPCTPKTIMDHEITRLLAASAPLPPGTRIRTTAGGIHTGGDHALSPSALASANKESAFNPGQPMWITGWVDLHADLIIPNPETMKP